MTHPYTKIFDIVVKVSALLLLLAQVVVPICLLIEEIKVYRRKGHAPICPAKAPLNQRILTGAIAVVYFTRIAALYQGKYYETDIHNLDDESFKGAYTITQERTKAIVADLKRRHLNILSDLYGQVDDFMNITYEGFVYIVNAFIVFATEDALNMVLNLLALEFVLKLDDEFKALYFDSNARAVDRLKKENPGLLTLPPRCETLFFRALSSLNKFAFVVVPLASVFFAVYGTYCKP